MMAAQNYHQNQNNNIQTMGKDSICNTIIAYPVPSSPTPRDKEKHSPDLGELTALMRR
jgi:hypothetical protein